MAFDVIQEGKIDRAGERPLLELAGGAHIQKRYAR
jgi:hypothetical protein